MDLKMSEHRAEDYAIGYCILENKKEGVFQYQLVFHSCEETDWRDVPPYDLESMSVNGKDMEFPNFNFFHDVDAMRGYAINPRHPKFAYIINGDGDTALLIDGEYSLEYNSRGQLLAVVDGYGFIKGGCYKVTSEMEVGDYVQDDDCGNFIKVPNTDRKTAILLQIAELQKELDELTDLEEREEVSCNMCGCPMYYDDENGIYSCSDSDCSRFAD